MHAYRKRIVIAFVTAGIAAASGVSLSAQSAEAYPPYDPDTHETDVTIPGVTDDDESPFNGTISGSTTGNVALGCDDYTWQSPPKVVLHNTEFLDEDVGEQVLWHIAVDDIIDQFNEVGATSAAIDSWESVSEPFTFGEWYADATPTIHVGFSRDFDSFANTEDAVGLELPQRFTDCSIRQAHIVFPTDIAWNFTTPMTTYGETYYDTKPWDSSYADWFRPAFLHELLHAFGLGHSSTTYSFMNYPGYDGMPWANRPDEESIRPLPADVRTLREMYPEPGSRSDVAVLNTWYEDQAAPEDLENGAASQALLCQPSLGDDWGERLSPSTCGTDGANNTQGSTEICAGDRLRTRFTLANYGTEDVDVAATLWFSSDAEFEASDFDSPTSRSFSVPAAHSQMNAFTFQVPDIVDVPGSEYHAIVYVVSASDPDGDGIPDAQSVRADSIPLRGTLEIC